MKSITYLDAAARQLLGLPEAVRERVIKKLERYAKTGAGDVTALKGRPGARLRVANYRVVFVETAQQISVRAVGHRREIYD